MGLSRISGGQAPNVISDGLVPRTELTSSSSWNSSIPIPGDPDMVDVPGAIGSAALTLRSGGIASPGSDPGGLGEVLGSEVD